MLKTIVSHIFVASMLFSSLSAQEPQYSKIFHGRCRMDDYNRNRVGHLVSMSFPSANQALNHDLSVQNPENPGTMNAIVGEITHMCLSGEPSDPITFGLRVSPNNRAVIEESLFSLGTDSTVEIEFVIYEQDSEKNTYFKRLHTSGKSIQLKIEPNCIETPEEEDGSRLAIFDRTPANFLFHLSLYPIEEKAEEVGFAFRSGGKQFKRTL